MIIITCYIISFDTTLQAQVVLLISIDDFQFSKYGTMKGLIDLPPGITHSMLHTPHCVEVTCALKTM